MDEITFASSLMGFNREQVLRYIDKITAEKMQQETLHEQQAEKSRDELGRLREEKERLQEQIDQLHTRLEQMQSQQEAEAKEKAELQEKLTRSSCEAADFKQRLFQREQDFLNLKKIRYTLEEQNKGLQEQLQAVQQTQTNADQEKLDLQKALQAAQAECEQRKQKLEQQKTAQAEQLAKLEAGCRDAITRARADEQKKLDSAEQQLAEMRRKLQQVQEETDIRLSEVRMELLEKASTERERMKRGAAAINQGVAELRNRLNEVDESIFRAAKDLENATQPIYDALDQAETHAHKLEGQMQRFPYGRTAQEETAAKSPVPEKKASPAAEPTAEGLEEQKRDVNRRVESLLEKLNHFLGES